MYKVIVDQNENWLAARSEEEALLKARELHGSKEVKVERDQDVLDTWFSSALLPLSATTHDPHRYPTTLIESGSDILFFWIAKMAMLCTHISGQLPFREINLHAMVSILDIYI